MHSGTERVEDNINLVIPWMKLKSIPYLILYDTNVSIIFLLKNNSFL